jgi:hypothetical protein
MARLVPLQPPGGQRPLGAYRETMWIAPDFDELPDQVAAAFGVSE